MFFTIGKCQALRDQRKNSKQQRILWIAWHLVSRKFFFPFQFLLTDHFALYQANEESEEKNLQEALEKKQKYLAKIKSVLCRKLRHENKKNKNNNLCLQAIYAA